MQTTCNKDKIFLKVNQLKRLSIYLQANVFIIYFFINDFFLLDTKLALAKIDSKKNPLRLLFRKGFFI